MNLINLLNDAHNNYIKYEETRRNDIQYNDTQ